MRVNDQASSTSSDPDLTAERRASSLRYPGQALLRTHVGAKDLLTTRTPFRKSFPLLSLALLPTRAFNYYRKDDIDASPPAHL
jgi:hypothetical protein